MTTERTFRLNLADSPFHPEGVTVNLTTDPEAAFVYRTEDDAADVAQLFNANTDETTFRVCASGLRVVTQLDGVVYWESRDRRRR